MNELERLMWSSKAMHAIDRLGIETLAELAVSRGRLTEAYAVGRKTLKEFERVLASHGLQFVDPMAEAKVEARKEASQARLSEILSLMDEGVSVRDIADRLGMENDAVYAYLHRRGLSARSYSTARKKANEVRLSEILSLRASGVSVQEIADRFDVSDKTIYAFLNSRGYSGTGEKAA